MDRALEIKFLNVSWIEKNKANKKHNWCSWDEKWGKFEVTLRVKKYVMKGTMLGLKLWWENKIKTIMLLEGNKIKRVKCLKEVILW